MGEGSYATIATQWHLGTATVKRWVAQQRREGHVRQRGTRPLSSIFGSISRGFQGTHDPRRACKPPRRQAAALSGAGGRARGAGAGHQGVPKRARGLGLRH